MKIKSIALSICLVTTIIHISNMKRYDECINRFAQAFSEAESGTLNALCMAYAKQGGKNNGK